MEAPVKSSRKLIADGAVIMAGGAGGCKAVAGVSNPCSISFSVLYGSWLPRMAGNGIVICC